MNRQPAPMESSTLMKARWRTLTAKSATPGTTARALNYRHLQVSVKQVMCVRLGLLRLHKQVLMQDTTQSQAVSTRSLANMALTKALSTSLHALLVTKVTIVTNKQ